MDGDAPILPGALAEAKAAGGLRADHLVHLRCEVATDSVVEDTAALWESHTVHLISLMDHTPGQRQFASTDQFRSYYKKKSGISDEELDVIVATRMDYHTRYSRPNREGLVALAHPRGIVLASHDDATPEHVAEAIGDGPRHRRIPHHVEAARLSHEAGIRVLMGAPNLVRGGSHTGNAAAEELARLGCSTPVLGLCARQPAVGPFDLVRRVPSIRWRRRCAWSPRTRRDAAKLTDRGEIAPGKRADLVRVAMAGDIPVARAVWREGARVA